jgi:hypothetical protein
MPLVVLLPLLVVVAVLVGSTLRARSRGYNFGSTVVVRCRAGHLFTTIWVPFVSAKAIRLGAVRWQRCPVANHWTFVMPVRDADLTEEDRVVAARYRDMPIP